MADIQITNNHLNLNLEPVGDNTYLNILKFKIYIMKSTKGDGHIHLQKLDKRFLDYFGLKVDGYVEFAWDKKVKKLFMYPSPIPETGYKLTEFDKDPNHYSVKCNKILNEIGFIIQPPKRKGAKASGVHPPFELYMHEYVKGLLIDLGEWVK